MNDRRHKAEEGLDLNTNRFITPMLDAAFQLLAFFIVFYRPAGFEGQMELSLPSDNPAKAERPEDIDPTVKPDKDKQLELKTDVMVIVRTRLDGRNNGDISSLALQTDAGRPEVGDLDGLSRELKKLAEKGNSANGIKIQADDKLKWDGVVQVMDRCRQAGFVNVSFVAPPNFGRSSQ
jgi:biopolymer transport protein ExbD